MSSRKVSKTENGENRFCYHPAVNTKIITLFWLHKKNHNFTLK